MKLNFNHTSYISFFSCVGLFSFIVRISRASVSFFVIVNIIPYLGAINIIYIISTTTERSIWENY